MAECVILMPFQRLDIQYLREVLIQRDDHRGTDTHSSETLSLV